MMRRFKGTLQLTFDTLKACTDLVERTHRKSVRSNLSFARHVLPHHTTAKLNALETGISGPIYETIRGVSAVVEGAVNGLAEHLPQTKTPLSTPLRSDATGNLSWWIDSAQGAVNGFFGDHLHRRKNDLSLGMKWVVQGQPVDFVDASTFADGGSKLCIFVHGLATTEWCWSLYAKEFHGDPACTFGSMLEDDLGYTPLYVRYNTGRHIAENGRALDALLTQLVAVYPHPLEEIVLIGHSMGGLVVRSCTHHAAGNQSPWLPHLRQICCLGSPHLGAPLEKGAHLLSLLLEGLDLSATQVCAELLNTRSAGILDLREGTITDQAQKDPHTPNEEDTQVPLLDAVRYLFLAATITQDPQHPMGQLLGDLLVRPASATGHTKEISRHIPFHDDHVLPGMTHLQMINHPAVYQVLKDALAQEPVPTP